MQAVGGAGVLTLLGCDRRQQAMVTLYTFGDSILDCGRYNEEGVHPGQLLVQNDDRLFPEFIGSGGDNGAGRLFSQAFWLVTLPKKFNLLTGLLTMSRLTLSLKQL